MIVKANVLITLQISLEQPWNPDARVSEVSKQAISSANMVVYQLLKDANGIRVIGEPDIKMVVTDLPDAATLKEENDE